MYVKIFAGILESSIASDTHLRRFFMDLLLLADQEGNVMATRDSIAHRLRTTREEVDWGLAKLMQPDEGSRNPDDEGRRLRAIEGLGYGWQIINYGFYRGIKNADELRAANVARQADFRARKASGMEQQMRQQNGRCGCCGERFETPFAKYVAQDHDHRTGKQRALLCASCNTTVGLLENGRTLHAGPKRDLAEQYVKRYVTLHNENNPSEADAGSEAKEPCPSPIGDVHAAVNGSDLLGDQIESKKRKPCPVAEIVSAYHDLLPELPKVFKITKARRGQIEARWREDLTDLDDWRLYFTRVRSSAFLMGKEPAGIGRSKPFIADLEWLTKEANFSKINEGKYDGKIQGKRNR
jgi:hypothetical protein